MADGEGKKAVMRKLVFVNSFIFSAQQERRKNLYRVQNLQVNKVIIDHLKDWWSVLFIMFR